MDLGKRIYDLRKEKNLSQGELAEMLDVSRQSISKWETNASTPELDKLLKMSEIFGISLDSLIKGTDETHSDVKSCPIDTVYTAKSLTQKIVGAILLCTGLLAFFILTILGGLLGGLFFSSPFITCGVICLTFKKRILLWCCWDVFFLVDVYLAYATGISRGSVLLTMQWTNQMNFARLYTAWGSLICLSLLIIATLIRFRKYVFKPNRKNLIMICSLMIFTAFLIVFTHLYGNYISHALENREYMSIAPITGFFRFVLFINEWAKISTFVTLLVTFIGFFKYKRINPC